MKISLEKLSIEAEYIESDMFQTIAWIESTLIGVFNTKNIMIDVGKYFLGVYSPVNCDAVIN